MKLEVGMWVRTKKGCICKILRETYSKYLLKNKELCYEVDKPINVNCELYVEDISKASHNIIDLIEVGDYVNGFPVIHKENDILKCGLLVQFKENEIKSIVTSQQFSAMEYRLGDK
jgi:hypothetical protein